MHLIAILSCLLYVTALSVSLHSGYILMSKSGDSEHFDWFNRNTVPKIQRHRLNCITTITFPLHINAASVKHIGAHLRTGQMSEVVEPVHVGPTVVKGMDELVCDHSVHVGLLVDVVLTQDDLQTNANIINVEQSHYFTPSEPDLSSLIP